MRRMLLAAALIGWIRLATTAGRPALAADVKVHAPADLEIGKVAPEIEAEDLDGVRFKLSEYRGKVVVLDFWGDW